MGLPNPDRDPLKGAVERFQPSRRAELLYVIVVWHVVSSSQHRRVPMHYVPVHL